METFASQYQVKAYILENVQVRLFQIIQYRNSTLTNIYCSRHEFRLVSQGSQNNYGVRAGRLALQIMRAMVLVERPHETSVISKPSKDNDNDNYTGAYNDDANNASDFNDDDANDKDYYDDADADGDGDSDWFDSGDYEDSEDDEDEYQEVGEGDTIGDDEIYPINLTPQQWDAANDLHQALKKGLRIQALFPLFHNLVKAVFTTQHPLAVEDRFHTPMEAFIVLSNIGFDGTFAHPRNVATSLSALQYLGLFMVAKECIASHDQFRCALKLLYDRSAFLTKSPVHSRVYLNGLIP
jgi:hypothetical protein